MEIIDRQRDCDRLQSFLIKVIINNQILLKSLRLMSSLPCIRNYLNTKYYLHVDTYLIYKWWQSRLALPSIVSYSHEDLNGDILSLIGKSNQQVHQIISREQRNAIWVRIATFIPKWDWHVNQMHPAIVHCSGMSTTAGPQIYSKCLKKILEIQIASWFSDYQVMITNGVLCTLSNWNLQFCTLFKVHKNKMVKNTWLDQILLMKLKMPQMLTNHFIQMSMHIGTPT